MSSNKLSSMVNKHTNKITLILLYTLLEWTLITLLLLNSILSYLTFKFAQYFNLKPPCLFCTHLNPQNKSSHRDLLCNVHAKEVSDLGFCLKHQRIAEVHGMCTICSSGVAEKSNFYMFCGKKIHTKIGFVEKDEICCGVGERSNFYEFCGEKIDKKIGFVEKDEVGEVGLRCSCCGVCEKINFYEFCGEKIDKKIDFVEKDEICCGVGERSNFYEFCGEKIDKKIDFVEKDEICSGVGERSNFYVFCDEKIGFVEEGKEIKVDLKCSCCGVEFKRKGVEFDNNNDNNNNSISNSCFVINSSWDLVKFAKDVNLVSGDMGEKDELEHEIEVQFNGKETEETEDLILFEKREELKSETLTQDLEFLFDCSGNQLVAIESVDDDLKVDEDQEFGDFQKAEDVIESRTETVTEEVLQEREETHSVLHVADKKTDELYQFAELDSMEYEETENSLVFHVNSCGFSDEKPEISGPIQAPSDSKEVQEIEGSDSDHEEAEVSIGTEIPVLDSCDEMKAQDNFNLYTLSHEEEPSSSSHDLDFKLEYGFQEARENKKIEELKNLNQEEDILFVIERMDSMMDESFDGSEMDDADPINTTEKLKSALRAERKVLQALYTELEEERSASEVAASETMAMINRLQEEKAAMQMEALHYQRMMEEQSEYDQEALQLLNELMVKKEKELELYRKKVLDYETKERIRFLTTSTKSGTCSASCSHSEDGDGMWVDLSHEVKEEGIHNGNQNTPVDTMMNLDTSFLDFEDERLSILEQLKVLEEKLFTLSDEEDQHFANFKQIEDYFEGNGKHLNGNHDFNGQEVNGITNGLPKEPSETCYQDRRSIGSTGKRLLPLFDALDNESDEGVITSNGHGNGFHSNKVEDVAVTRFELQKKRIDIEEEVDQLYVRLQALEADREFLKHCIGSLKKGDKGMELLQEILQHLRDLRNVDLREKSLTDGTLV